MYLYKGGTSGVANAGNEPYSEFYASQIAEAMGISHVTYGLKKWKGLLCYLQHRQAFGLMVDNKTNRSVSFAPLFDHGLSFLNYATDDDLNNIDEYVKTRTPAFEGVTFDELVKEFMTNRQRDMLRKLLTFEFERHPRYNLPKKRLKIIEKWIKRRAGDMLR